MTEEEQVMVDYERAQNAALRRCKDYATLAAFQIGKTESDVTYFDHCTESGYFINGPGAKYAFFFDHFESEREPAVEVGLIRHSRTRRGIDIYALKEGEEWLDGKPVRSDEYWNNEK